MRSRLYIVICLAIVLMATSLAGQASAQTKPAPAVQATPAMNACNIGTRLAIDTARKPSPSATKIHWPGGPVNMTEREMAGSNKIITVRCNLAERDVWIENGHLWVPECGNDFAPLSVDMPQMSSVGPEGPQGPAGPTGPQGPKGEDAKPTTPAPTPTTAKTDEVKPAEVKQPEVVQQASWCSINTKKMEKSQWREYVELRCKLEMELVNGSIEGARIQVRGQNLALNKDAARTVESTCTDTEISEGIIGDAAVAQALAGNQPTFASAGAGTTKAWTTKTSSTHTCSMTPAAAKLYEKITKFAIQMANPCSGGFLNINRLTPGCYNNGATAGFSGGFGVSGGGGWGGGLSLGAPAAVMGNSYIADGTVPVANGPVVGMTPGNHVGIVPTTIGGIVSSGQPTNGVGSTQVTPGAIQPGKVPGNHIGDSRVPVSPGPTPTIKK